MERALPKVRIEATRAATDEGLPLRLSDVVLTSVSTVALALLVFKARGVPGFWGAVVTFVIIGAGPLVLRALAMRFRGWRLLDLLASGWLLPAAIFGHAAMGPLIDAINPRLLDASLANADLRLFGEHPSITLGRWVGGAATDVLMVCYYSYFLWPVLVGAAMYTQGARRLFDEYVLALTLCFAVNFAFYALVPAVGPRFFLANSYGGPLQGWLVTPYLESLMRQPVFMRDCFPSGHTGVTLLVLIYAYNHRRSLFCVMLPAATGIVLATLVGRFHYGIDLIAAVPMTIAAASAANLLAKARPEGVVVTPPPPGWREALRARLEEALVARR